MFKRTLLTLFFVLSIGIIVFGGTTVYFIFKILKPNRPEKTSIVFQINKGEGISQIGQNLENQGLIDSVFIFKLYSYLLNNNKFIAGKHSINKNMSLVELTKALTSSNVIKQERRITIIEGWDSKEIGIYLEKENVVSKEDFVNFIKNPLKRYKEKHPKILDSLNNKSLEGYLFPDTYIISKSADTEMIVNKMLDNLKNKLISANLLNTIKEQGKSLPEILVMASILEKEVQTFKDKKTVAGIFYNRIGKNMPLQADSTINYITQKGMGRSAYKDLKIDNPYNTYKYIGLPPGPICNPGMDAIKAAINPSQTDYLYFLTSKDGTVYYAKNFADHKKNRKYLD